MPVGELLGVTAVAADASGSREISPVESLISMVLLDNGTVMYQTSNDSFPTELSGLVGVTAITDGSYNLALLNNGTVMEVAENSAPEHIKPVSGITNATAIASSETNGAALLSDGTVRTWGTDANGALGDGGGEGTEVPVEVCAVGTEGTCPDGPYLSGVKSIALGEDSGAALLSDGTVVTWGHGDPTPVAVSGLSGVQAISAGGGHFNALMSDGTVQEWSGSGVPATVSGVNGATAISSGTTFNIALIGNGTAMTWGQNKVGQLGDGSRRASAVPVVKGLTGAVGISAGYDNALAFGTPNPPAVKKLSPTTGPATGGTTVTITGTHLNGAEVAFGSTPAEITSDTSNSITVVSPSANAGAADVTVTTPGGTSPIAPKVLRFTLTPTITSVTPNKGSTTGGTSVTISGTGFAVGIGTSQFKFANKSGTSVNCTSTTTCTVVSPAHLEAGTVEVRASVNKATSPVDPPADQFTYE